ncbi:MAG: COX15/CtaA family protein [Gemmatimonadetes bacterium]|nr:COX15/CtaA family protein [Gemmatimonadota bacterium]
MQAFEQYPQIPEAQTVHAGITLVRKFKNLSSGMGHRLIARLSGIIIAIPFFYLPFAATHPPRTSDPPANLPTLVPRRRGDGWYVAERDCRSARR